MRAGRRWIDHRAPSSSASSASSSSSSSRALEVATDSVEVLIGVVVQRAHCLAVAHPEVDLCVCVCWLLNALARMCVCVFVCARMREDNA